MSELRKTYPGGLFFVTLTIVGWIDVFNRRIYIEELIRNLKYCQDAKGLKIYCYCIMSSHIHIIAATEEKRLGDVLRDFKSYSAKQIIKLIQDNPHESRKEWMLYMFKFFAKRNNHNSTYQFWQQINYAIDLFSPTVIDQKVDYIHNNPVEAGLVNHPENYVYSSANPKSEIKVLDL
jgi:putative transposase